MGLYSSNYTFWEGYYWPIPIEIRHFNNKDKNRMPLCCWILNRMRRKCSWGSKKYSLMTNECLWEVWGDGWPWVVLDFDLLVSPAAATTSRNLGEWICFGDDEDLMLMGNVATNLSIINQIGKKALDFIPICLGIPWPVQCCHEPVNRNLIGVVE